MCEHTKAPPSFTCIPNFLAHKKVHNNESQTQLTSGGCLCFSVIVSTSSEPRTAVAPAGPAIAPGGSSCWLFHRAPIFQLYKDSLDLLDDFPIYTSHKEFAF